LIAASLLAVNATTIVPSTATPGAIWTRFPRVTDARFSVDIPLFIDPVGGDDDNDGLLVGTALKTRAEWARRMNGQTLRQGGTIIVTCAAGDLGDFAECKLISDSVFAGGATQIHFIGAKSLSGAGTVSSIVSQNPATQTEFQFTDSSGLGPVIAADSRLRLLTGVAAGAVGVVRGFGGGGATNPFTGPFMTATSTIAAFPAALDTYAVETLLSTISGDAAEVQGLGQNTLHILWEDFLVASGPSSVPGISEITNETLAIRDHLPTYVNCKFTIVLLTRIETANQRFIGGEFTTPVFTTGYGTDYFEGCVFRAAASFRSTATIIGSGTVIEATSEGITGAILLEDDLLLSRILAGTGFNVNALTNLNIDGHQLWSPVIGARNAMAIGMNVQTLARAEALSFSQVANLSAAIPVLLNGAAITAFTADGPGACGFVCTSNVAPVGRVDGWLGISRVPGSYVAGGGKWATPGDKQAGGVLFSALCPGSNVPTALLDPSGVAFFPTLQKRSYRFKLNILLASEGNAPTVGLDETFEFVVLAAQQISPNPLVIHAVSAVNYVLNPFGYGVVVTPTGAVGQFIMTVTHPEAFSIRVEVWLEWIELAVTL
jgi:hypothetical protein